MQYLASTESTYLLENDPALVAPLVDQAQRTLEAIGLCDATTRVRVGVALEEALYNALYHGNLEITTEQLDDARSNLVLGGAADPVAERRSQPPFSDRKIFFQMSLSHTEARFTVRDEGAGFDPEAFSGDVSLGSLEGGRGRGLLLMKTFMNDVSYNDRGNEITLIKRRDAN